MILVTTPKPSGVPEIRNEALIIHRFQEVEFVAMPLAFTVYI